jgi:Electron transfer DM13
MTAIVPAPSKRSSGARAARAIALILAAAATTAAGVYVAGGVITNDFQASMALTAGWFAAAGAVALASLKTGRSTGLPIFAGYLMAATAIGGYLAATTLNDKTVNEVVATAEPAAARLQDPAPRNVLETRGSFVSGEHTTRGTARTIRLANGRRVLTLTGFETDAGPDLRVRIVPGSSTDGGADDATDLGALKGNKGDQQYDLPDGLRPRDHTVVVWCRAFSAQFGSAQLQDA